MTFQTGQTKWDGGSSNFRMLPNTRKNFLDYFPLQNQTPEFFFFLFYVKKSGSTKTQPSPFSNLLIMMSCFRLKTIFDPKPNMTRPICHVCLRKKPKWTLPRAGIHASRMSRLFYINRLTAYKLNKELNCRLVVK